MKELRVGEPEVVAPGVRRVLAPNPGRMTGPGTNTYLIGERELVVLDPGPALEAQVDALLAAIGTARVVAIAVTHTHRDHSPAAALLRARTAAPLVGAVPRHAAFHDRSFVADLAAHGGTSLETDCGRLVAIATPGHASNHLCWHLPGARLLFTGDHVLGTVSPVILAPDGDMGEYLDSLARLEALDLAALAPGHGPLLRDPPAVLGALIRHRRAREQKVLDALAAIGAGELAALLPIVYSDVAPELHDVACYSLEAHLIKLERDGRTRRDGAAWRAA
ncbi:MAG TPA: MBL fold metallo-hydrolase [Steroidobacteraceae bacterium]|nr:MBL fold metallo-hydrolase [Steroidobacteraceae bacterium]